MTMAPYTSVGGSFVPSGGPSGGGLDSVHPGPADPYNHAKVQHALNIIEQHPGISAQMMQTIMAEALGPAQAQIDQRQQASTQAFDTASQGLLGLATSGQGTPQGLDALTNAYQAISPSLNRPAISGRLDALTSSAGQVANSMLPDAGVSASSFTPEDQPLLASAVQQQYAALTDPTDPVALKAIIDTVRQQAIAQGKNEQGITAAIDYAKLVLSRLAGTSRTDLVGMLNPPPDAGSTSSTTAEILARQPGWLPH